MMWRAREGVETAYIRHANFISLMTETVVNTSQWLSNFLTGPQLSLHYWSLLSANCDSSNSIHISDKTIQNYNYDEDVNINVLNKSKSKLFVSGVGEKIVVLGDCEGPLVSDKSIKSEEFSFINFKKFLRNEWDAIGHIKRGTNEKEFVLYKFVREMSELLEVADIKSTNL